MNHLDKYLEIYGEALDVEPSIYYLWKQAQKYVEADDEKQIKRVGNLIFLLHISMVSPRTRLGNDVKFSYGGIGAVIHVNSIIGDGVAIGQGVTIGGSPGKCGVDESGNKFWVPFISKNVYIAAGARILGGVKIGKFSVIAANSVVLSDVEDFSIYAGQPAKIRKRLTQDNCLKYKSFFHSLKGVNNKEYVSLFPKS